MTTNKSTFRVSWSTLFEKVQKSRQSLSPKGEILKELNEGSLWFECLSFTLPYLDLEVNFPKEPVALIVTGGRADGRADGGIF